MQFGEVLNYSTTAFFLLFSFLCPALWFDLLFFLIEFSRPTQTIPLAFPSYIKIQDLMNSSASEEMECPKSKDQNKLGPIIDTASLTGHSAEESYGNLLRQRGIVDAAKFSARERMPKTSQSYLPLLLQPTKGCRRK